MSSSDPIVQEDLNPHHQHDGGEDKQDDDENDDDTKATKPCCCFFMKFGKCDPPRPPCRWNHVVDTGQPCCFGGTCRMGHAKRVIVTTRGGETNNSNATATYWKKQKNHCTAINGDCPADRDANLLRSQLEPWPTAVLRERLARVFPLKSSNETHGDNIEEENQKRLRELDPLGRDEIMNSILNVYEQSGCTRRKMIRVEGIPVSTETCDNLLSLLHDWKARHSSNTRPSIHAQSYMILRNPKEFSQQNSRQAKKAAKKLAENQELWDAAQRAIQQVDSEYANNFSALAVTYGFQGSPHIDKQNTGPFYGLALGDFPDGEGGICVEAEPLVVAHVNTKNRFGKVDGRYPHWVAPYDANRYERYSLIFYSTWQKYQAPGPAYFGQPIDLHEVI